MYRNLKLLHLWLGLILAVPLTIVSVTGALLIFGPEMQAKINPEEWYVQESGAPLPFEILLQRFAEQLPGIKVNVIALDQPEEHAWRFWLGGGQGVANVDPVTGNVLKHYQNNETVYGYVLQLHRWLLVPNGEMRSWARNLMSILALIVIVQLILGIWVWAIPPRRLKRLKIPTRSNTQFLLMRLHSVTGLFMSTLLFLIALTGVSFHWHGAIEKVVELVTFSEVREREKVKIAPGSGNRNIDLAVQSALNTIGQGSLLSVSVPDSNSKPVNVRVQSPGALNNNLIVVDPVTAKVLTTRLARDKTRAETFMGIAFKLHIGDFSGLFIRCLWIIVSLMPVFFISSGVWVYLQRRAVRQMRGMHGSRSIKV